MSGKRASVSTDGLGWVGLKRYPRRFTITNTSEPRPRRAKVVGSGMRIS